MTKQKSFKERIRARMDKTGESYATARRQLINKAETEARKAQAPRTVSRMRSNEDSLHTSTGHTYDEWFELLDRWGARQLKHPEIARWLSGEHEVDGWWAQHITVAYEQERGMRAPGQRADGTYSVTASKTVNVPIGKLFEAFTDDEVRGRWLGEYEFDIRTARPTKSITANWEGTATRLNLGFDVKGNDKSKVALAHEKLTDPKQADELKLFWRERMNLLKKLLES